MIKILGNNYYFIFKSIFLWPIIQYEVDHGCLSISGVQWLVPAIANGIMTVEVIEASGAWSFTPNAFEKIFVKLFILLYQISEKWNDILLNANDKNVSLFLNIFIFYKFCYVKSLNFNHYWVMGCEFYFSNCKYTLIGRV